MSPMCSANEEIQGEVMLEAEEQWDLCRRATWAERYVAPTKKHSRSHHALAIAVTPLLWHGVFVCGFGSNAGGADCCRSVHEVWVHALQGGGVGRSKVRDTGAGAGQGRARGLDGACRDCGGLARAPCAVVGQPVPHPGDADRHPSPLPSHEVLLRSCLCIAVFLHERHIPNVGQDHSLHSQTRAFVVLPGRHMCSLDMRDCLTSKPGLLMRRILGAGLQPRRRRQQRE